MRNRVQVFVALLLLLGAAVDLVVPGVCSAEELPASHEHAVMTDSHRDFTSPPDGITAWGDDCFCCSRVTSPRFAEVLPAPATLEAVPRLKSALIDEPPARTFHPPRK